MEDEAQHNIEEEKRKSRILTDVSYPPKYPLNQESTAPLAHRLLVRKLIGSSSLQSRVSILVGRDLYRIESLDDLLVDL